jgi:hypothetical protein
MQHVDRFETRGQIDHATGPSGIPYADLINTHADGLHRLPVFRIKAALHEIQIEAGVPPRLIRERPDRYLPARLLKSALENKIAERLTPSGTSSESSAARCIISTGRKRSRLDR